MRGESIAERREAAPPERKEERAGEADEMLPDGVGPGVDTVGAAEVVDVVGDWRDSCERVASSSARSLATSSS